MRQAGRYLPEYRKLRKEAKSFLDFCLTPEMAVEATLQPIRRFGFDGAILFSDILVVPFALGQEVWFEDTVGPRLRPIEPGRNLPVLEPARFQDVLEPVYETLRRLRKELPKQTALIGFAGAPWTVASYMIEGGSSKDFALAKAWAYGFPESFKELIDLLVEAISRHLISQAEAGAEVLQLFESWAGVWPESALRRWCLAPAAEIRRRVKAIYPQVPMILFPRGAGALYAAYAAESGAEALSLDTTVPLGWAREHLQGRVSLQGNLDPLLLVTGGSALHDEVSRILEVLGSGPFVFNLGHGITPAAAPRQVANLVKQVRAWKPRESGP